MRELNTACESSTLTAEDLANLDCNRAVAAAYCASRNPDEVAKQLQEPKRFYQEVCKFSAGWKGLYAGDLLGRLPGMRILDVGGGTGEDAIFMASLGAQVTSIDVAKECGDFLSRVARLLGVESRITPISADVCTAEFPGRSFDLILGNGILHHLTHNQENQCLRRVSHWVTRTGEVRFFENAENNFLIDNLRWVIPMRDRPSCLSRKKFAEYKKINPSHPSRSNSSRHYRKAAGRYFADVCISPIAGLQRLHRFFRPNRDAERSAKKRALVWEAKLPHALQLWLARYQTILCTSPLLTTVDFATTGNYDAPARGASRAPHALCLHATSTPSPRRV